jgi:hypothetical protein
VLRDLDPGYDRLGSSTERSAANAKVCFPLTQSIWAGGDGGQAWGIFAHTPRRQPSAAERQISDSDPKSCR